MENDWRKRKDLLWVIGLYQGSRAQGKPPQELMFYFTLSSPCFIELLLGQSVSVGGYPLLECLHSPTMITFSLYVFVAASNLRFYLLFLLTN